MSTTTTENRNITLDIVRGIAVILMIGAHALYFFHTDTNLLLRIFSRFANTITFTLFLFVSGAVSSLRFSKEINNKNLWIRTGMRSFMLFAQYVLVGFAMTISDSSSKPLVNVSLLSSMLTFSVVPRFSEFLLTLTFFSITAPVLYIYTKKLLQSPFSLYLNFVVLSLLATFLYTIPVPISLASFKALVVGQDTFIRFPFISYLPVFLVGLWCGIHIFQKNTHTSYTFLKIHLLVFGILSILAALINIIFTVPSIDILSRWPPSIGFLSYGLFISFLLLLISTVSTNKLYSKLYEYLAFLGKISFDLFIIHILLLAAYDGIFGIRSDNISIVLLMSGILFVLTFFIAVIIPSKNALLKKYHSHFHYIHYYRIKKRFILLVLIVLLFSSFDLHKNPHATTLGGVIPLKQLPQSISLSSNRTWYLLDNELNNTPYTITLISSSPTSITPSYTIIGTNKTGVLTKKTESIYEAVINTNSLLPGNYQVVAEMNDGKGSTRLSNVISLVVSMPIYISWTFDWEGWDVPDNALETMNMLEKTYRIHFTHFVSPRTFFPEIVGEKRADILTSWLQSMESAGDEIALHLHMHFDLIQKAGILPKTSNHWGYRSDEGYDVPTTSYTKDELTTILDFGRNALLNRGFHEIIGYRAGGWYADSTVLQVVSQLGFSYDASGREKPLTGAFKNTHWDIPITSLPYYPSVNNQNITGTETLPILEIPNNGNTTFDLTSDEIYKRFKIIYPDETFANSRGVISYVSHPQFADREFPRLKESLQKLYQHSFNIDVGPVVFVTQRELFNKFK